MNNHSPGSSGAGRSKNIGAWLLLVSAWLYLFTYSRSLNNPNERTRVLQARALAEHGQLHVGEAFRDAAGRLRIRDLYGQVHDGQFVNDLALVCSDPDQKPPDCAGRLYPAKAPGTALLGVPWIALGRWLGAVPPGEAGEKVATWILRTLGVSLWMLLGLWAFIRLLDLAGLAQGLRQRLLLATGLGTGLFPYGIMFVGHALASAALVAGVLFLVQAGRARARFVWASLAGLAAGYAVCLEYHALIGALAIAAWSVLSPQRKSLLPGFGLGGLLVFGLFAGLHLAMFGHPLTTGHAFLLSAHNRASQATGFLGVGGPHPMALLEHLFDTYLGLIPLMPWLVWAGVAGVGPALRGRLGSLPPGASRTLLFIVLGYWVFVSLLQQWRVMNGWSIGPRYLVPAMLPMAFLAAVGWQRLGAFKAWLGYLTAGLAAAAMAAVSVVTAAYPSPPAELANPFAELALPLLAQGMGVRNAGHWLGLGRFSLLPFGVLIGCALAWVLWPVEPGPRNKKWLRAGLALAVCAVWLGWLALVRPVPEAVRARWLDFARNTVESAP